MTETERQLRERLAHVEEENRWLRDMLAPPGFLPTIFKLTEHEGRLLKALLSRSEWTREALLASVYLDSDEPDLPEIRMVDSLVCKLRPKIKPLGIEIETLWGKGFRVAPAVRAKAAKLIDDEHEKDRLALQGEDAPPAFTSLSRDVGLPHTPQYP